MTEYSGGAPTAPMAPNPDNPNDAKARAAAEKAYRKAQRPWYKKKRFIIPLVLVVIIALAQLAPDGDAADSNQAVTATEEAAAPEENSAPAEEEAEEVPAEPVEEAPAEEEPAEAAAAAPAFPGAQEGDIVVQAGETLEMSGVSITVSPLSYVSDVLGEYLIADVTIVNNSEETVSYESFEFELQNPGGSVESTTFGGTDNYLGSGDLVPGGSVSGQLPWDAKNGDETGQFVVLYEPFSFFSSDRGAWIANR